MISCFVSGNVLYARCRAVFPSVSFKSIIFEALKGRRCLTIIGPQPFNIA